MVAKLVICALTISWVWLPGPSTAQLPPQQLLEQILPGLSLYDFGLHPNKGFVDNIATTRPQPSCYPTSVKVASGICGPTSSFNGKYTSNICLGSALQAQQVRANFEAISVSWDYEFCLDMFLHHSNLLTECGKLNGKFWLVEMLATRRAILPDCCLSLLNATVEKCNCASSKLSDFCTQSCCCENAIVALLPKGSTAVQQATRNTLTKAFTTIQGEIADLVRRHCCSTRFYDQCQSTADCAVTTTVTGYLEQHTALPVCCGDCLRYYVDQCTYTTLDAAGNPIIHAMDDSRHRAATEALCREEKFCSDTPPCLSRSAAPRRWEGLGGAAAAWVAAAAATAVAALHGAGVGRPSQG